jgi:hypothetical protein
MHRILFLPDIRPQGYPPDSGYPAGYLAFITLFLEKISNKIYEQVLNITPLSKHKAKHFLVTLSILCKFFSSLI